MESKIIKKKENKNVEKPIEIKRNNNNSYLGFKSKYMFLMFLGTCHT